jgi:hypothetical protein
MGRLGQALLNGGELDGKRILKPETLALMWTPQFRASDQLPPICMGFYQDWRNHLRWIGHEGDLIAFHSLFFVEPTQKIVLFVSYNSAGGGNQPRPEIINFFTDRYFPGAPSVQYLKKPVSELNAIEGTYQSTRRDDTTKLKVYSLLSQGTITVNKDGVMPVGKDLWQAEDDQAHIFAIRDTNGKIVRLAVDFPGVQLQRVPWYENQAWVLIALVSSISILSLVVLASILRAGRRTFLRRRPRPAPQPGTIWLSAEPRLAAFIWVVLIAVLAAFFAIKGDDLMPPTPEWFKWFALQNFVTVLAVVVSVLAVIVGIKSWGRPMRFITRLKFSLVALA